MIVCLYRLLFCYVLIVLSRHSLNKFFYKMFDHFISKLVNNAQNHVR